MKKRKKKKEEENRERGEKQKTKGKVTLNTRMRKQEKKDIYKRWEGRERERGRARRFICTGNKSCTV